MKRIVYLLAALAAALSVADYLAHRASHRQLTATAEETGLFEVLPSLPTQLRRETEPARAATLVAWALLDLETDHGWLTELTAAEQAAQAKLGIRRLRLARRLAEETLRHRPASWQAAMTLGVSHYLEAERTGQRQLPRSSWRRPLLAAMALAPGHREPPLFLASALLSRWSSLSSAERDDTLPVVARALEAPGGLELLLQPWVRLAPSMDELLRVVPDRPEAWKMLAQTFLLADDLEHFGAAHQRWLDSLPAYYADQVARARARLEGGAPRLALALNRNVAAAPADLSFADSFAEALAMLPDVIDNRRLAEDLRRWMNWALDLCILESCPLGSDSLARLADMVDDPHPAQAALAAVAIGDLDAAGELEPTAGSGVDTEWHRYWVYKAERIAGTDPDAASAALARAWPDARQDPLYWRASQRLAELRGDGPTGAQAREELDRLAHSDWATADWSLGNRSHRLVLLTAEHHRGLRLELQGMPATGAAVEVRWDGRILGVADLQPGEDLLWSLPAEPGIHQLTVANLSGRPLLPGPLSLTTEPAPG
ncbi:MAG: hypothetical protein ACE5EG_01385 [Thermoanaerobaculia bacterium]